jgi:hypothetical protein
MPSPFNMFQLKWVTFTGLSINHGLCHLHASCLTVNIVAEDRQSASIYQSIHNQKNSHRVQQVLGLGRSVRYLNPNELRAGATEKQCQYCQHTTSCTCLLLPLPQPCNLFLFLFVPLVSRIAQGDNLSSVDLYFVACCCPRAAFAHPDRPLSHHLSRASSGCLLSLCNLVLQ